jgi:coenzyme F420-reducing hydrogenase delta subunit/cytochrome c2
MVERKDGKRHKYVAEVNPKLCVACGICIGSCQPDALSLNGQFGDIQLRTLVQQATTTSGSAVRLVFTCERHAAQAKLIVANEQDNQIGKVLSDPVNTLVIPVTCIGMVHPKLAEAGLRAGATEVLFIGCPPEDCANREGNLWMAQRLSRLRLPKLHLRFSSAPIFTIWTPPDRFKKALSQVKEPAEASAYNLQLVLNNWYSYLPAVILSALTIGVIVLLSRVPYQVYTQGQAMVEIVLDHQRGSLLDGAVLEAQSGGNDLLRLVVEVDGHVVIDKRYSPVKDTDKLAILERAWVSPGKAPVRVSLYDSTAQSPTQILYDQTIELSPDDVLVLNFHDQKSGGDAEEGERIFYGGAANTRAGCAVCHSLEPEISVVGPSLAGVAERAGTRVPGLSAEDYLRQSILTPDTYVVEGYSTGLMPANYAEILDEQQVKDVLAFLATLK